MEDNRKEKQMSSGIIGKTDEYTLIDFGNGQFGIDIYENRQHVKSVYFHKGNVFEYARKKKCG